MEFDTFTILVLITLGFMTLFITLLGVWYWKFGRKLIQN